MVLDLKTFIATGVLGLSTTVFGTAVESPRKVAGLKGISDIFPDHWDIVDWNSLRRSGATFAYIGTAPERGEHSGTPIVRPTGISCRPPELLFLRAKKIRPRMTLPPGNPPRGS